MRGVLSDRRADIGLSMLLLLLGGLIVLGQANPLTTQMGRDSGVFAYIASHLLQGKTPYLFAWDHKPPLIYFINALALFLGRGSRWGIWAVEVVSLTGSTLLAFSVLRRRFGLASALAGCAALLIGLNRLLFGGNFTEEYSLPFSFIALWLFSRLLSDPNEALSHFGIGAAFSLSLLLRPNNAGVQAAIWLTEAILIWPKIGRSALLRAVLSSALGVLLPLAAVAVFFTSRHAFTPFLQAAFIYNWYYSLHVNLWTTLIRAGLDLGLLALIGGLGLAAAARLLLRQPHPPDPWIVWLLIDAALEWVLSALSGRNFVHYFINGLPALAVATALLVDQLLRGWKRRPALPPALLIVAALVGTCLIWWQTLAQYGSSLQQMIEARSLLQKSNAVIEYVGSQTEPDQTVFVYGGELGINFLAHREAPTAQILYGKLVASPLTDALAAQFLTEMLAQPPTLIIDRGLAGMVPLTVDDPVTWASAHNVYAEPGLEEFFGFVHGNYVAQKSVAGMQVYRWSEDTGGEP